jgi:hypothetical protein
MVPYNPGLMLAPAFTALTEMLVMPVFFLSVVLYPLNGLPAGLTALTRQAVFEQHLLSPATTRAGWAVTVGWR